jgi:adenine-specific DNA-methyltransferase
MNTDTTTPIGRRIEEGLSLDLVQENINQLGQLFPEVVKEGKLDFEALNDLLGNYKDIAEERYCLNWAGKANARREAQKRCSGTLRPCRKESKDWDTTENLYIEGDNLEVLKLLQKSYHGRIKMIYIDPPYNTGKDFVYTDNYKDNLENYLKQIGEDRSLSTKALSDSDGRFHSKWLNMMYPRLKLARNLLTEDGVIFISIDDSEVNNLRKICDEIYGSINFIACLVYDKNRKNDAKFFSVGHEYILAYFKNISYYKENGLVFRESKEGVDLVREEFNRLRKEYNDDWVKVNKGLKELYSSWPDDDEKKPLARFTKVDEKGPYRDDGNISWPGGGGPKYIVLHPITQKPCKCPDAGWRFPTPKRMKEEIDHGRVVFGEDETTLPRIRRNLFEYDKQVMRSVRFSYAQTATQEFNKIFDGKRVFENPKSVSDIKDLIQYIIPDYESDIILDFFSGSATTAHAVMELNSVTQGKRQYILVQLPEATGEKSVARKEGYNNLCEIGKERIRRAGKMIKEASPLTTQDLDTGFKVYKLDSSNINAWDSNPDHLEESLEQSLFNIKTDRTDEDLLSELLLKLGLSLTAKINEHDVAGEKVYEIGDGELIVCLSDHLNIELAEGIGQLWKQVKQEGSDIKCRVVFKDTGFNGEKGDEIKSNTILILKQHGIDNVTTI